MPQQMRIITGRTPVDWELPVTVVTNDGEPFSTVFPAIYLMSIQRRALAAKLNSAGTEIDGKWRIPNEWIESRTRKPKNPDAEANLVWKEQKSGAQLRREAAPKSPDRMAFLDFVHSKGVLEMSRAEIELTWFAFVHCVAEWLLLHRKPVDMVFIKLHPSPYRTNWKSILIGRFKNLGKLLCSTGEVKREILMMESGLTEAMLSLDLLSFNEREGYCNVFVEVEHRPSWWKLVKDSESARLLEHKANGYATRFMDFVNRNLPTTSRLYTLWLSEIARPTVATDQGQSAVDWQFVANDGRNELFPRYHPPCPTDCIVANKIGLRAGFGSARDLLEAYAVVPTVPDIQSPYQNVWNIGTDVSGSGDGETNGVPVLPAGEKPNES